MRAPFQIRRFKMQDGNGYCFVLLNEDNIEVAVANAYSNSPIAPQGLRDLQARLNSKVVLDEICG